LQLWLQLQLIFHLNSQISQALVVHLMTAVVGAMQSWCMIKKKQANVGPD
jgi:hypothetical protein